MVSPLFRKSLVAVPEPAQAPRQEVHPPRGLVLDHGHLRGHRGHIAKEGSGLRLKSGWAGPRELPGTDLMSAMQSACWAGTLAKQAFAVRVLLCAQAALMGGSAVLHP